MNVLSRILPHVRKVPPPRRDGTLRTYCWIWQRARNSSGYGSLKVAGRTRVVHRLTFEALREPIPDGYVLDHVCRRRGCCNPEHLEAVTVHENTLRGVSTVHKARICRRCGAERTRKRACTKSKGGFRYDCPVCEAARGR